MDLGLTWRRVLVTGASRGIGEGLAHAFAVEGCELFLTAGAVCSPCSPWMAA